MSSAIKIVVLAGAVALTVSGCTYDYLQHSDRVGYSAGDAVKANLEGQTTNPSKRSMYSTAGIGKNGSFFKDVPKTDPSTIE
jgi:hypothetical protein